MNDDIASITTCGFCEVFAESRYTSGLPLMTRFNKGKSFLMIAALKVIVMVYFSKR